MPNLVRKDSFSLQNLLFNNPILLLFVSFIIGVVLGDSLFSYLVNSIEALFFLPVSIFFFLVFLASNKCTKTFTKHVFLALLVAGSALLGVVLLVDERRETMVAWPDEALGFKSVVLSPPRSLEKGDRVNVRLLSGLYEGKEISLFLMRRDGVEIKCGDGLICFAKIENLKNGGNPGAFNYAKWMERQGISGNSFCSADRWEKVDVHDAEIPLTTKALQLRERLLSRYESYFEGWNLSVLSAMTLGDKSRLTNEIRNDFSIGGVSHVLALSGLHLSILFGFFQSLLLTHVRKRLLLCFSVLLLSGGMWMFAFLAGLSYSLLRAVLMMSCFQVLSLLRRDNVSVNNWAIAGFLLLLWSPQSLFDIGYQLSFLSVLGLLVVLPYLSKLRKGSTFNPLPWLYDLLLASLVAQLATGPLVAYYFHQIPTYGCLVNLFVVPLTSVVLYASLAFLVFPFLEEGLAWGIDSVLSLMEGVIDFFVSLPFPVISWTPSLSCVYVCYLLLVFLMYYFLVKRYRKMLGCVVGLFLCISVDFFCKQNENSAPQLHFYHSHSVSSVHAILSPSHSYLWAAPHDFPSSAFQQIERDFWKRSNISAPQVMNEDFEDSLIVFKSPILWFSGCRVALPEAFLPPKVPAQPLPVDYLLYSKECRFALTRLSDYFVPNVVVLDVRLSALRREKCLQEALRLGWKVHDLYNEGALFVNL